MALLLVAYVFIPLDTVAAQEAPMQETGKGEGQAEIVAWAGYIERGATNAACAWVTDFEAETSCMVNVKTAATPREFGPSHHPLIH